LPIVCESEARVETAKASDSEPVPIKASPRSIAVFQVRNARRSPPSPAAKIRSVTEHSVRGAAKIANVGSGKIGEATTILEYGKDLVDQVIAGTMPLNKAYEKAQRRKKELQSDEAQLARLQNRPVLVKLMSAMLR
jgi:hypothetical protein